MKQFESILSCLNSTSISTISNNLYVSQRLRAVAENVFEGNDEQPYYEEILERIVDGLETGFNPPLLVNEE